MDGGRPHAKLLEHDSIDSAESCAMPTTSHAIKANEVIHGERKFSTAAEPTTKSAAPVEGAEVDSATSSLKSSEAGPNKASMHGEVGFMTTVVEGRSNDTYSGSRWAAPEDGQDPVDSGSHNSGICAQSSLRRAASAGGEEVESDSTGSVGENDATGAGPRSRQAPLVEREEVDAVGSGRLSNVTGSEETSNYVLPSLRSGGADWGPERDVIPYEEKWLKASNEEWEWERSQLKKL